jgi:putative RecB family exonuclease
LYSHSRLGCFEKCPRQFRYRYVDRLPAPSEGIEAFVGKRVHEIIERLHLFVREGRVPPLPDVLRRFRTLWSEKFEPDRIRIVRHGESPDDYRAMGERCLTNFYRRGYPFDADETLGLEERVKFALDDAGAYPVQGIIDRLVRARDGALEIHDYKTSRRIPPQHVLDKDRQLAFYELGVRARLPEEGEIRLVWHYLQPGAVRTSTRSPEQLTALRQKSIALIDRILGEEEYAPRPSPLCAWCEYNDRCPASTAKPATPLATPVQEPPPEPPSATPPVEPPAPPARGQLSLL